MPIDLDRLLELAEKATPGPWQIELGPNGLPYEMLGMFNGTLLDKVLECNWGCATQRGQNDYAYIAAVDPDTIRALVKCVRALRLVISHADIAASFMRPQTNARHNIENAIHMARESLAPFGE